MQVPPNTTARLQLKLESLLGADVSGAKVEITWGSQSGSGAFNMTTDANVSSSVGCLSDVARVCVCGGGGLQYWVVQTFKVQKHMATCYRRVELNSSSHWTRQTARRLAAAPMWVFRVHASCDAHAALAQPPHICHNA